MCTLSLCVCTWFIIWPNYKNQSNGKLLNFLLCFERDLSLVMLALVREIFSNLFKWLTNHDFLIDYLLNSQFIPIWIRGCKYQMFTFLPGRVALAVSVQTVSWFHMFLAMENDGDEQNLLCLFVLVGLRFELSMVFMFTNQSFCSHIHFGKSEWHLLFIIKVGCKQI